MVLDADKIVAEVLKSPQKVFETVKYASKITINFYKMQSISMTNPNLFILYIQMS